MASVDCDLSFGRFHLTSDSGRITGVRISTAGGISGPGDWDDVTREAALQLEEYFTGQRTVFTVETRCSGTAFQKRVWEALLAVPYGRTRTYGQIARDAGSPGASRAAGGACGANPLMILVPCHRIIGSSGSLTGFGGGLELKKRLLALENPERRAP